MVRVHPAPPPASAWADVGRGEMLRDVTKDEDGRQGRRIGPALSSLRSMALTLLRLFIPAPHIPDAQRMISAMDDNGLALLTTPPLEHRKALSRSRAALLPL